MTSGVPYGKRISFTHNSLGFLTGLSWLQCLYPLPFEENGVLTYPFTVEVPMQNLEAKIIELEKANAVLQGQCGTLTAICIGLIVVMLITAYRLK